MNIGLIICTGKVVITYDAWRLVSQHCECYAVDNSNVYHVSFHISIIKNINVILGEPSIQGPSSITSHCSSPFFG